MIPRLKVRAEFLAAAKAAWQARPGVVIQAKEREDTDIKVGFTCTKKVGNAVVRNRCKRRMREAAEAMIPQYGLSGHDYVLIARAGTDTRDWQALLDDVKAALIRLSRPKPNSKVADFGQGDRPPELMRGSHAAPELQIGKRTSDE